MHYLWHNLYLFFSTRICNWLEQICTNFLQAHAKLSVDARAGGRKNVSLDKIKFSVTFLLNVNIIWRKTVASYRFTSPTQDFTSFQDIHQKPILVMLKFLHLVHKQNFTHPGAPGYEPIAEFQPLIDHADRVLWQHYIPH
jgi:hypothetical protein